MYPHTQDLITRPKNPQATLRIRAHVSHIKKGFSSLFSLFCLSNPCFLVFLLFFRDSRNLLYLFGNTIHVCVLRAVSSVCSSVCSRAREEQMLSAVYKQTNKQTNTLLFNVALLRVVSCMYIRHLDTNVREGMARRNRFSRSFTPPTLSAVFSLGKKTKFGTWLRRGLLLSVPMFTIVCLCLHKRIKVSN